MNGATIYAMMEERAAGVVKYYHEDLRVHDYNIVMAETWERFIWGVRETGTSLYYGRGQIYTGDMRAHQWYAIDAITGRFEAVTVDAAERMALVWLPDLDWLDNRKTRANRDWHTVLVAAGDYVGDGKLDYAPVIERDGGYMATFSDQGLARFYVPHDSFCRCKGCLQRPGRYTDAYQFSWRDVESWEDGVIRLKTAPAVVDSGLEMAAV